MNGHLSPAEWTAALEGTLAPARTLHLEACDACREEHAALRRVLAEVEAVPAPSEPPPLFWDHLTDRIRLAVGTPTAPRSAWQRWRQPAMALAAAAVLLIWLIGREPLPDAPGPEGARGESTDASQTADERWDAVVELAAELSVDDVHGAVPLRRDAVVLFDDLTVDEQTALGDLLERELKGLE